VRGSARECEGVRGSVREREEARERERESTVRGDGRVGERGHDIHKSGE
jgi:hypothetical protein